MVKIEVHREIYNFLNGKRQEKCIFEVANEDPSLARKLFEIFQGTGKLAGGDIVSFWREDKYTHGYRICDICDKNACVEDTDKCEYCSYEKPALRYDTHRLPSLDRINGGYSQPMRRRQPSSALKFIDKSWKADKDWIRSIT